MEVRIKIRQRSPFPMPWKWEIYVGKRLVTASDSPMPLKMRRTEPLETPSTV